MSDEHRALMRALFPERAAALGYREPAPPNDAAEREHLRERDEHERAVMRQRIDAQHDAVLRLVDRVVALEELVRELGDGDGGYLVHCEGMEIVSMPMHIEAGCTLTVDLAPMARRATFLGLRVAERDSGTPAGLVSLVRYTAKGFGVTPSLDLGYFACPPGKFARLQPLSCSAHCPVSLELRNDAASWTNFAASALFETVEV